VQQFNPQPGVLIPTVVTEVSSAAVKAGIKPGDVILAVDGKPLDASAEALPFVRQVIQEHPNQPLTLKIQRDSETLSLKVTPEPGPDGQGRIGVQLYPNGNTVRRRAANLLEAFSKGASEFQKITILTGQGFVQLISNFSQTANQVAGPVKIVEIGASIAQSNAGNLFQFAALISINLAIINILPLPALDGGQLAFLLIEGLRGKPLPTHIQDGIMQTGLMVLLGLGIFLIVRDTANLEWVQKLFQ
jgi:RIP metalloprotease RseP